MLAAANGHSSTVQLLADAHADLAQRNKNTSTALMLAATSASGETVELLLDAGANPARRDVQHRTAADYAREAGDPDIAMLLARAEDQQGFSLF